MNLDLVVQFVAGVVGIPVVNFLKNAFGLSGRAAVVLTAFVAFVLSAIAHLVVGDVAFGSLESVFSAFSIVFATATIIYKMVS